MAKKRYSGTQKLTIVVPWESKQRLEMEAAEFGLTLSEYAWIVLVSIVRTPDVGDLVNVASPSPGLTAAGLKNFAKKERAPDSNLELYGRSLAWKICYIAMNKIKRQVQQNRNPQPLRKIRHQSAPDNWSLTQKPPVSDETNQPEHSE